MTSMTEKKGSDILLYDAILVLNSGEIRYITDVKLISLTRARMLITNDDDETELFRCGEVKKIELTAKGAKL